MGARTIRTRSRSTRNVTAWERDGKTWWRRAREDEKEKEKQRQRKREKNKRMTLETRYIMIGWGKLELEKKGGGLWD
jgi:hypothetical protein